MILHAEKIQKRYLRKSRNANNFYAVQETTLTLPENALTVLCGRSGSGKTTLLQMLSGMLSPTDGKVTADGTDLYALSDASLSAFRNRNFGVVPQGQAAVHSLSVLENILLPRQLYGINPAEAKKDALLLMERFGIAGLKDVLPGELSGGELRRMSIARGMINHPQVLFADEPTGDLDDENSQIVLQYLREISSETTVLLVTHEMESIQFADHVWKMESGRLECDLESDQGHAGLNS